MSEQIDWEKVRTDIRERAAIAAMQGLLANPNESGPTVVQEAVWYADKLIAELQEEVN